MRRVCVCMLFLIAASVWAQETEPLGDVARKLRESKPKNTASSWSHENFVRVSMSGKPWAVAIEAPGFIAEQDETKPNGRRYLLASNQSTGMVVSITLEQSPKGADIKTCPDYLHGRVEGLQGLTLTDIRYSTTATMAKVEYLVPEAGGVPVRQQNLVACTAKDDIYVDIHLSKAEYKSEDAPLFQTLLEAVHIVAATATLKDTVAGEPDSRPYFERGSRYFLQERYREAIEPYWNALEIEKRNPKLERNLWRVLVDNLGMAYGITGDLNNAEATLRYGLSQDPTYPMFSYNMACVYGERNDLENALAYLNTAYRNRANNIPGERLPDPRGDNSFKRFWNNPKFRVVADSFTRAN